MQRLPWLIFDNVASGDLETIFKNANVHIIDDGTGGPKYITVIDITNLGVSILTIADLLAATTQWVTIGGAPEIGGVAWDTSKNKDYKIGDVVVYNNIVYWSGIENRSNNFFVPSEWNKVDRGGELFDPLSNYLIGDVVTHDDSGLGMDYVVYTRSANTVPAPSVWTAADWTRAGGEPEKGGVLHTTVGQAYAVGDMVNLDGSSFIYVCKTAHTSTVACDTGPDDANWYQPPAAPYAPVTYNFTTDLLGTACGSAPAGPHVETPPDENGPCWFSVAMGSAGRTAEVQLEGFELAPADYDTTLDGYIKILSPVANNSWLKVII